jgi:hypothetical protein
MLASVPAGAFKPALISSNGTTLLAAPRPAARTTQAPIVINYAPNLVINSADSADAAALRRRVMDVLERHGRELHQTLARELLRQQRRDF